MRDNASLTLWCFDLLIFSLITAMFNFCSDYLKNLMDINLINEVKEKRILHWNYKGMIDLPIELKHYGELVEDLYLKWNNITILPPWICELKFLTNLYLYGNGLEHIPDEIGELLSLSSLYLENNNLTALPKTIGKLRNLNYLNLELNHIEALPAEIGLLKALYVLNLKGNGLKELPAEVCLLNSLQELILDCNQLTYLPRNIVYLPNLNYLSVNLNMLMFLPSIWFISNPQVNFIHNAFLNYLPFDWGSGLTKGGKFLINGSLWNFDILGCDTNRIDINELPNRKGVLVDDKLLVLPSLLKKFFGSGSQFVPSLIELAARNLYNTMFQTTDIRRCLYPDILHLLPHEIKQTIWQGPVAICHRCKMPIFTECILWIITKYILNHGQGMPNTNQILASIYFCSKNCTNRFTEYELDNENELMENITSQKMGWTVCP